MDLNSKIAARREEMARQQRQEQAERGAAAARQKVAEEGQRRAALDVIASDLPANGLTVTREGDGLTMSTPEPPPLDVEGLRRSQIARLVNREARQLWTPRGNWIVVGCIVGGVCLLHVAGLGLIPLGIGLLVRSSLNKKYRAQVRARFPSLLAEAAPQAT